MPSERGERNSFRSDRQVERIFRGPLAPGYCDSRPPISVDHSRRCPLRSFDRSPRRLFDAIDNTYISRYDNYISR
jgi:hypothetical protein